VMKIWEFRAHIVFFQLWNIYARKKIECFSRL